MQPRPQVPLIDRSITNGTPPTGRTIGGFGTKPTPQDLAKILRERDDLADVLVTEPPVAPPVTPPVAPPTTPPVAPPVAPPAEPQEAGFHNPSLGGALDAGPTPGQSYDPTKHFTGISNPNLPETGGPYYGKFDPRGMSVADWLRQQQMVREPFTGGG